VASTGGIVFALTARDLASKAVGKVNNSLGKLGTAGKLAAVGIGFASAATAALGKIALDAVQAAAQDERSTILLNAALKQRGFNVLELTGRIDEQINAMARLGIEDDQVRAGLEIGSRFFKDQELLLRANAVAAQISAATGKDLSEVMMTLGKASQGQGKGLKELGIATEKTVKKTVYKTKTDELGHRITVRTTKAIKQQVSIQDILTAATAKYGGIADELANSTSGRFAAAQIQFAEAMEKLGYDLLPAVNEFLTFIVKDALPVFRDIISAIGPVITDLIDNAVRPLAASFNELFSVFGADSKTAVQGLVIALTPLKLLLQAMKIAIDAIVVGLKTLFAAQGTLGRAGTTSAGYSPYLANAVAAGTFSGAPSSMMTTNNIFIGTGKVDTVVTDSINRTGTFKRGR
jgi:hypothetical protein